MARRILIFDKPDRFVCGTVGPAGQRTFFLQAVQGPRVTSVVLEKVQVAVLAERLGEIIMEIERRGVEGADAPAIGDPSRPLDEPLREEFRVGAIALAWDDDDKVLVVEAREQTGDEDADIEVDDDDEEGPDLIRVSLAPAAARGFVERASLVLAGGRPPCPFCGQPLDPQGHLCPRRNGFLN